MGIYAIPGVGTAISGSDSQDTIFFAGPTAVASANSVLGLSGNDVIYLGAQGRTGVASATVALGSGASAGVTTLLLSAHLVGSATYSTSTALATGAANSVAVTGIVTAQRGVRSYDTVQLWGNAGNDSISIGESLSTVSNSTIGGGAGNDRISNASFVNSVWTAAGAFTGSTATALSADNFFIEGGGGDDSLSFIFATATFRSSTIQASQGNDTISLQLGTAGSATYTASQLLLGGGDDALSAQVDSVRGSTVAGGGGNDTLYFSAVSGTMSNTLIVGDTFNTVSTFDGNDSIVISAVAGSISSNTIQAGFGDDSLFLAFSGGTVADGANLFQLNAGNDYMSADYLSSDTVEAGAGNDSIVITTGALSTLFTLGGGNDTLYISANTSDMASGTTVFGGSGADVISGLAGAANTAVATTFGYNAYTDSYLGQMDTIAIGGTATSGSYTFYFTPGGLSLGNFTATAASATNGVVTFTATFDSDLTSRVAYLNSNLTTTGAAVAFTNSGTNNDIDAYLFIQGGSTDLLVQISTAATAGVVNSLTLSSTKQVTVNLS